jgi:tripartite-type tricarboxylate transporter receptor subunit TctC
MSPPRFVFWLFSVGAMLTVAGMACGQNYPSRVVRILTTEPGTSTDVAARLIAQGLTGSLGQPVIVENRGIMAVETVAKAPPDGHSLVLYTSPLWLTPFMRDNASWDPVRDFAPITLVLNSPYVLVAHASLPVNTLGELIALAKARPGELNYGSSSAGSANHLAAELFKAMAGVNIVRVPYKGAGPALSAMLAGQVQVMFAGPGAVAPHVKTGRLKALAVTTAQPSALAPGLPTVAASGLPGYEASSLAGMFAPAKTPALVVTRLNQEIVRIIRRADVKERLFDFGTEGIGNSPEEFAATIKSEMAAMGKLIKDVGIRAE